MNDSVCFPAAARRPSARRGSVRAALLGLFALSLTAACAAAPSRPGPTREPVFAQTGGTLIVSNMSDNSVTMLDATSRVRRATLPTGIGPHEVATSHDGRWAVVSNYGPREAPGNSITVIDVYWKSVVRTIDLGEIRRPHGLAFLPGDTLLLVTSETSRAVFLIDFRTGRAVRRLASGGRGTHMIGLSADGRRMVAGNIADGTLAVFEVFGGDSSRAIKVARQPEGVAITPDGTQAWVGSNQDKVVLVVDLATGATLDTISGFGLPYRLAVTPNGLLVVVTDPVNAVVRVFNAKTRREQFRIDIPRENVVATAEVAGSPSPEGVAVSRDSRWAFVTLQGSNRVAYIDLEHGLITGYGVTGNWSDGIAYSQR